MVIGHCGNCGEITAGCPQCLNVIRIDPETDLPPDVARNPNGEGFITIEPTLEAQLRSVQMPLCDVCVEETMRRAPHKGLITEEERHRQHFNREYNSRGD